MDLMFTYASGSFEIMVRELWFREAMKGTDIPITVGILIADCRQAFCAQYILNYWKSLNKDSGVLIDFYLPGYVKLQKEKNDSDITIRLGNEEYRFLPDDFDEFAKRMKEKGIKVTGRAQLLLVPYENGHLWFKDALVYDLEKSKEVERAGSVKLFFEYLIAISKKTTDFEIFKETIQGDMRRTAILDFVKEKLLDYALSAIGMS